MGSLGVEMKENRRGVCQSERFPRILIVLALILTALGTASRCVAQAPSDTPLKFKIIGRFYDPEKDKTAGGVNAFTVNILKKTWILDIEDSHTLEGSALGSSVLKKIYPPIMSFVGPKELTDQLTNPAIVGKTCTLTGQLYVGRRLFRLTQVQGPEEQGEAGADAKVDSASD